jgi:hypothetical protein
VAGRTAARTFSYVDEAASATDLHPSRRGQHGVGGDSIGLETTSRFIGHGRCEPNFHTGPQITIGALLGSPVEMLSGSQLILAIKKIQFFVAQIIVTQMVQVWRWEAHLKYMGPEHSHMRSYMKHSNDSSSEMVT